METKLCKRSRISCNFGQRWIFLFKKAVVWILACQHLTNFKLYDGNSCVVIYIDPNYSVSVYRVLKKKPWGIICVEVTLTEHWQTGAQQKTEQLIMKNICRRSLPSIGQYSPNSFYMCYIEESFSLRRIMQSFFKAEFSVSLENVATVNCFT